MKNFINFGFIKRFFIVIFLFAIFVFISAASYADAVSEDLADSVFRLHVIANSDSKEDQDLKYKVRDSILEYMNTISKACSSKSEVINMAHEHKEDLQNIAEEVIRENGYDYTVNIKIGNFAFPTKTYGDISFPAGNYDALRIEIGEAAGQNWWCVMFPPLCFVDVSSGIVPDESKETIQNNLNNEEEYSIISDDKSPDIKFKFSLIEFFKGINFAKTSN
jgi:stage II sporulation protein R